MLHLLGQFWSRTDRGLGFPHTPDNNHRVESGGTPPETKHQIQCTTIKTAGMDLTNNTCTTSGCRYVQAREQKII